LSLDLSGKTLSITRIHQSDLTSPSANQPNANKQSYLLLPDINHNLSGLIKPQWFDIAFWQQQNAVTGSSVGRNTTWFIGHQDDEWVLRHYYRGGLIGKWLKDRYCFSQLKKTRCYAELLLLEQMYQQGLKVPKPIAGYVVRQGLFYRADLLIEKIPHSQDLVQYLKHNQLSEFHWHNLGAMIAKFHEAGIYHSDLNAHNILINNNDEFYLIDFDKCDQRSVDKTWQQQNLTRLLRSFKKEDGLHANFNFEAKHWHWFSQGYQNFHH
jgi:3-deoxy-D-manno-octulosonic acid kinase